MSDTHDNLAVPPHNIEAEQSALGSMMLESTALELGLGMLKAADFYRPSHQAVFAAMESLVEEQAEVDLITLQDKLRDMGQLEDVGETEYLMALVETVPTASHLKYYADIVLGDSLLRRQMTFGLQLQARIASKIETDPNVIADWMGAEVDSLNIQRGSGLTKIQSVLMPHWTQISAHKDAPGLIGYSTGFSHLDSRTGGFGQPMYVLLKADRGTGKTHLAIQSSVLALRAGQAVVFASMDTPERLMMNRYIAHLSGINSFRVNNPGEDEWQAISDAYAWLWDKPLYFEWDAGVTVRQLRAKCKAVIAAGDNLGMLVIDYAEMLGYSGKYSNHEQELGEVAKGLKNLRDELGITILLLSQVNSDGQERWSRSLGNLADVVMTWAKDQSESNGRGVGRIVCEKNRFASNFRIDCYYDAGLSRIRETHLDESDPSYPPSWPWWLDESEESEQTHAEPVPSYPVMSAAGVRATEDED